MKAKVLCARCRKFMYWGETTDGSPSHGICHACLRKHFPDFAEALDPPPPTAEEREHPFRHYVCFERSDLYHYTDDDKHTICKKLIHGQDLSGNHMGDIMNYPPQYHHLCSLCAAIVAREHL